MKLQLKLVALGILRRVLRLVGGAIPVRPKKWVIGGDRQLAPEGNSLHLFRHVLQHRPDLRLIWISRSTACVETIRSSGGEAYLNFSVHGIFHVLTAEVYCFSIDPSDVELVNPSRTMVVNLWHGMPMKKIIYDAADSKLRTVSRPTIWQRFAAGVKWSDVVFHIATSSYYAEILASAFRGGAVEITGEPRCDLFFKPDRGERAAKIRRSMGWEKRRIVTYLPTHRKYGKGARAQPLFAARESEVRARFGADVLIVTKNHSLMASAKSGTATGFRIELERGSIETQDLLLVTDILVTDYSSVFVDFLLTDRPIYFLWSDDYATADNELYFSDPRLLPGTVVATERELEDALASALNCSRQDADRRRELMGRYHAYCDGRGSERVLQTIDRYQAVVREKREERRG